MSSTSTSVRTTSTAPTARTPEPTKPCAPVLVPTACTAAPAPPRSTTPTAVAGIIDCSPTIVVGEYIGAQNAAADVATPLSANDAIPQSRRRRSRCPLSGSPADLRRQRRSLQHCASRVRARFRLPMPAMNSLSIRLTGVLNGGIPNGTGTSTFTVHATDLVEPSQPAVDATFNITVVDAVTVDDIVIPDGHQQRDDIRESHRLGWRNSISVDRGARQLRVCRLP